MNSSTKWRLIFTFVNLARIVSNCAELCWIWDFTIFWRVRFVKLESYSSSAFWKIIGFEQRLKITWEMSIELALFPPVCERHIPHLVTFVCRHWHHSPNRVTSSPIRIHFVRTEFRVKDTYLIILSYYIGYVYSIWILIFN